MTRRANSAHRAPSSAAAPRPGLAWSNATWRAGTHAALNSNARSDATSSAPSNVKLWWFSWGLPSFRRLKCPSTVPRGGSSTCEPTPRRSRRSLAIHPEVRPARSHPGRARRRGFRPPRRRARRRGRNRQESESALASAAPSARGSSSPLLTARRVTKCAFSSGQSSSEMGLVARNVFGFDPATEDKNAGECIVTACRSPAVGEREPPPTHDKTSATRARPDSVRSVVAFGRFRFRFRFPLGARSAARPSSRPPVELVARRAMRASVRGESRRRRSRGQTPARSADDERARAPPSIASPDPAARARGPAAPSPNSAFVVVEPVPVPV